MTTAERIRQLGFKRWYERALIESHAYFVTAFLGMIATFAGIELIGMRESSWNVALGVSTATFGTAIALFGIHRYHRLLMFAETLGDHAVCRNCNTYAAFDVVASAMERDETDTADAGMLWLRVQCRKCRHQWTM